MLIYSLFLCLSVFLFSYLEWNQCKRTKYTIWDFVSDSLYSLSLFTFIFLFWLLFVLLLMIIKLQINLLQFVCLCWQMVKKRVKNLFGLGWALGCDLANSWLRLFWKTCGTWEDHANILWFLNFLYQSQQIVIN
jgi:hypothetical protein